MNASSAGIAAALPDGPEVLSRAFNIPNMYTRVVLAEASHARKKTVPRLAQRCAAAFASSIQSVPTHDVRPEIMEADGLRIVRGLILSPVTGTAPAVATVQAALAGSGFSAQISPADGGTAAVDAICATGMVASEPETGLTTTVVVWGDVLGTGEIPLSQLTRAASSFNGANPLEGPDLLAADFDSSGKVDLTDLVLTAGLYTAYSAAHEAAG